MASIEDITDFEQHIYNTFLKFSRGRKNLPYKYRKDFSDIDPILSRNLKKLSIFFAKFPHIDLYDFIQAPYKVYPDTEYFELSFYTTLKAIKAFSLYQERKITLSPDSDEQLENIKSSLMFISKFCKENNIDVNDYIYHNTNNTPTFLLHLKEHRINVYCLFGFTSFDQMLKSVDFDILTFIIGNSLIDNLPTLRAKYLNSNKARKFVELGLQKIQNKT
jgi:hypothetical protein